MPSKKFVFIYFNESPFKMVEKCFLFILKSFFVLEIFTFLSWRFGCVKNGLIRNVWLISKFITLQTGQHIIIIHTLRNIPRSEGNHIVKFGHLTEYNMSNIFLGKSYTKCIGEACPRPFNLFLICKYAEKVKLFYYNTPFISFNIS